METRLDAANRLAEEGRMEEALGVLRAALGECPDHAAANFAYARLLDGLGREREAIPHYEHSIACGLPDEELQKATVNLGSSYRAVGEHHRAVEVLRGFSCESWLRPLRTVGWPPTDGLSRTMPKSSLVGVVRVSRVFGASVSGG